LEKIASTPERTVRPMSVLSVVEYVSVDGVIQGPGHAGEDASGGFELGGWTGPFMDEHRRYAGEVLPHAGAILLGRLTYDIWATYWPTVTDPADEIAAALNSLPKYVASRTLESAPWPGTTVVRDVPAEVAALRAKPGGDILVMGSSVLAHTLAEHDLVDRYELWVHPVVLGRGKRLFADGAAPRELRLANSRTTEAGLVLLTYER
jgi:dihydrofolate reductase